MIPKLSGDIRPLIPKLGLRNYWYPAIDRPEGRLAQAGQGRAAGGGDLSLPRRHRRRRRHPGHLPASGRAPERGRLPLQGHGGLPVPRLGVRRVRQERGRALRGPGLRRVRQAGHRGEGLSHPHAQGPRLRLDRRRASPRRSSRTSPRSSSTRSALVQIGQVVLAVQLGGRARELDGLARQLRAPQRGGGGAQRLHRAGRAGRAPDLRRQRLRRRRGREQLHAPQPAQDIYANGWKWPKTNYRRFWTWLTKPLAERARRNIPPPRSAQVVRRPSPARHVPRRVRLGPLHAHVRAGRGAPDAGLVLPLHAAQDRARAVLGPAHVRERCAGGSSSTTSPARTRR